MRAPQRDVLPLPGGRAGSPESRPRARTWCKARDRGGRTAWGLPSVFQKRRSIAVPTLGTLVLGQITVCHGWLLNPEIPNMEVTPD